MILESDAIRDVLLFLEDNLIYEDFDSPSPHIHNGFMMWKIADELDKNDDEIYRSDIIYAVEQLYKAGFISSNRPLKSDKDGNIEYLKITDITFKGHELLNSIRRDDVWNEVKNQAKRLGGLPIMAIETAASTIIQQIISNPGFIQGIIQNLNL